MVMAPRRVNMVHPLITNMVHPHLLANIHPPLITNMVHPLLANMVHPRFRVQCQRLLPLPLRQHLRPRPTSPSVAHLFILSIFVDACLTQVSVGAKGLTFSPSDFTAANGTIVNFVFSKYDCVLLRIFCNDAHFLTAASLIPSRNLRSRALARIWQRPAASLPGSILAYRPGSNSPSRSPTIKHV